MKKNKLLFNQGYQIEIIGDADIETSGGKRTFLILPSTEEYPDTKYLGNISFYEKRDYYTSAGMYLSGNLVNSLSDYLDTSKKSLSKHTQLIKLLMYKPAIFLKTESRIYRHLKILSL